MGITKSDPSRYGHLHSSTPQPSAAREGTLRFRTAEPIPYSERDESCGLALDVSLTCEGECDWVVCDASVFGRSCVPGAGLNEQLENELCLALQIALTKLSSRGVPYAALPGRSDEIGESLAEDLFPLWRERRGIQATRFRLTSVAPRKEEVEKLAELRLEAAERVVAEAQKSAEFPWPAETQKPAAAAEGVWVCPGCGRENRENFCSNCGEKRPE